MKRTLHPKQLSIAILRSLLLLVLVVSQAGIKAVTSIMPEVAADDVSALDHDQAREQNALPAGARPGYLIVTPQRLVDAHVFEEFVAFKEGLGFAIYMETTETIAATTPRFDFAEQVREYLKRAYRQNSFGPANVRYVLLVGDEGLIPFRQIYPKWRSRQDQGGATYSDWYYADLTGDWDSNGDGIFGQGAQFADPADAGVAAAPADLAACCLDQGYEYLKIVQEGEMPKRRKELTCPSVAYWQLFVQLVPSCTSFHMEVYHESLAYYPA